MTEKEEKEIDLIVKLTEASIIIAELRAENKILKDVYDKLIQSSCIKKISNKTIDDIKRICRFYLEWTNVRESNGVELFELDYELKYASQRVLKEFNTIFSASNKEQ